MGLSWLKRITRCNNGTSSGRKRWRNEMKYLSFQARPENSSQPKWKQEPISKKSNQEREINLSGIGLGNRITSGDCRLLDSPKDIKSLMWRNIGNWKNRSLMGSYTQKAAGIKWIKAGRTSHALIVGSRSGSGSLLWVSGKRYQRQ